MQSHSPSIAVFSFAYAPFEGGAEVAIREIMARSKDRHFVVLTHRFLRAWKGEEVADNVSVIRLGKGSDRNFYERTFFEKVGYIWRAWRAAEALHRELPFRGIWAVMASYAGFAALLFKLRHPEVPFLLTLQEGDSEEHILRRVGIFYFFWKKIFKKADHIQVISKYLADFARRHGATCPIEVVPNGVAIEKFQAPSTKFQINSNYQLPITNYKTIVTTSRLVHKNGIDVLLRALAFLHSYQLPITNYRLLIAGDGPLRGELEMLARNLSIIERVEFLGSVSAEKIPEVLQRGNIFVRPSRSEGLGSSFLEAMAAGLPIIGTPVGGIPDFLRDGETGFFARVDDPEDLAKQIERLLTDEPLRARLIKNGMAVVEKYYTWDSIVERMENIFKNLCV